MTMSAFTCICGAALILLMVGLVVVIARPVEDSNKKVHGRSVPECDLGSYFDSKSHNCQPCTSCGMGASVDNCELYVGPGECVPCDNGWYQDEDNYKDPACKPCRHCRNRVVLQRCTRTSNAVCGNCKPGFYLHRMFGTCESCALVRGQKPDVCKRKTTPAPAPVEIREPTESPTSSETGGAQSTPSVVTSQPRMSSSFFPTNLPEIVTVMSSHKASTDEDVNHPADDVPDKSEVTDGETPEHVVTGASKISPGPGVNFFLRLVPAVIFIMTVIFTVKLMWDHRKLLIYRRNMGNLCQVHSCNNYPTVKLQERSNEERASGEIYQEQTIPLETVREENENGNQAAPSLLETQPDHEENDCGDQAAPLLPGSDRLPDLVMVLQEKIDDDFLKGLKDYFVICDKLPPKFSDDIEDFPGCVNMMTEVNDWELRDVMDRVFTLANLKKKSSLCGIIKEFIPDVGSRPPESKHVTEDGGNNYLEQIKTSLRQNNLSDMKLVDLEVDAEIGKLVEKEVKGCGDIYAIAVDLKVSHETAHRLTHFESLENVLEMSHPDLKVIDFAEVLLKSKRVAAVKHIDKMLKRKAWNEV